MINTTTNLKLKLYAKTHRTTVTVTGSAVPQKMRTPSAKKLTASQVSFLASKGVTAPTNNIITINNTTSVTNVVSGSGTSSELTLYSLSSIVPYNEEVTIATVVVRVDDVSNYKIPLKPDVSIIEDLENSGLDKNTSLRLRLTDTVSDSNNNTTSWTFNLIYRASIKVSDVNKLEYNLNHKVRPIVSRELKIKEFTFGGSKQFSFGKGTNILSTGQSKKFYIYGTPGTPFQLSLRDNSRTDYYKSSILSSTVASAVVEGDIPIIKTTIPSKGVYTFTQAFSKIPLIRKTAINGSMAASGATKIIFDSLTDVQVGDQLFMKEIPYSSVITVIALNPDTNNVNECTLSGTVTAADNAVARFRRSTSYDLQLTSTSDISSIIPSTMPTYTFNQYRDPLLTIKLDTARSDYTVNGVTPAGDAYEIRYPGKANITSGSRLMPTYVKRTVSFTYTLDGVGSKTFTLSRQPLYSDWTNTNYTLNGGTHFNFNALKAVLSTSGDGHSNGIATITGTINIIHWGKTDVTTLLNLDNFIS